MLEHRSIGVPDRVLERWSTGEEEHQSVRATKRWSSRASEQRSARAAERQSNIATERWRAGTTAPRNVRRRSFTADNLRGLLSAHRSHNVRHQSHAVGRVPTHLTVGSPQGALLSSGPFWSKRHPRMGIFQVLRAIFQKWESSGTW